MRVRQSLVGDAGELPSSSLLCRRPRTAVNLEQLTCANKCYFDSRKVCTYCVCMWINHHLKMTDFVPLGGRRRPLAATLEAILEQGRAFGRSH